MLVFVINRSSALQRRSNTVRQWDGSEAAGPRAPGPCLRPARPRARPLLRLPADPIPDPCKAPAKSPQVTCAGTKAGCGAPGLVRVPGAHSVVLSGRVAASVGTRGSCAKAAGSLRTQTERTRTAMATPAQDALRRALRPRFLSLSAQGTRGAALMGAVGGGGPWRPLAALRPAGSGSGI